MQNNKDVAQKIVILILSILLVIVLCFPLKIIVDSAGFSMPGQDSDPGDTSQFNEIVSYKINANTILESVNGNKIPELLPESALSSDSNTYSGLAWTQADYMKIVRALFEFVWKETLNSNWSMHKMSFQTRCKDNLDGFESGTFVFYQLIFQNEELSYNARAITISPSYEQVIWGGDSTFYRPIFGATMVDTDKLGITADEVLDISEDNGGRATRESVQNNCEINLFFNGNWDVYYFGPDNLPILHIEGIDPYTGIIKSNSK